MLKPTRLYYENGISQILPYNQWDSQYVPRRMIPEYLSALTDVAQILYIWDKYYSFVPAVRLSNSLPARRSR